MKKLFLLFFIPSLVYCAKPIHMHSSTRIKHEIRGVWVPDPQYTDVMKTYENVQNFVATLDTLNFNAIFMVSYALNKTLYPSEVLLANSNYSHVDSTSLLTPFMTAYNVPKKSPTGDPVRDLINEAHRRKIKVIFWYEFGFMADIKPATPENNPILAKNPHWVGIGNDGKPASYNSHDYYFNAYDTDVQNFIFNIVMEGINKYPDVDGIQGDDRLPAMCANGGYDAVTVARYKAEHNGQTPPVDYKDSLWFKWRLDILNRFGERLYSSVKQKSPDILVSFAPNPFPWCRDNLMQDWPQWVGNGICDLLAVQCYRRDSASYRNTVLQARSFFNPPSNKRTLFVPGILLMVSGEISEAGILKKQVLINRALKADGEVFFYNEGLKSPAIRKVIKELYTEKADFPL